MNLNKLKHAVTLSDEGNFARAAIKLHISQPALSRSISGLEDELGLRLFDRDQAGAVATVAGRQLVTRARDLLYAANSVQHEMQLFRQCESGRVAFGTGPFPAASFLPPILSELAISHPRLRASVEVNNSAYLLEHLKAEQIEFFIADTRTVAPTRNVVVTPLGRQRGALLCRAGHPLAGKSRLAIAQLREYAFASVQLPEQILSTLRNFFQLEAEQELPISTMCDNIFVLKHVATHSNTILMCTRAAAAADIKEGSLVELQVATLPELSAEMGIVHLERRSLSPMAELVLSKVREQMSGFCER